MANRTPDLSLPARLMGVIRGGFTRTPRTPQKKSSLASSLSIWTIVLAVLVQQSVFARAYVQPTTGEHRSEAALSEAGRLFIDASSGSRVVRVTDSRDGEARLASRGSSFNLDSSRFIVNLDGAPMLYSMDQSTFAIHKQGSVFETFGSSAVQADSLHWSAVDAGTIIALESADSPRILSHDTRSGTRTLLKDFSDSLGNGEAQQLSKSTLDDNHFAFVWRERGSNPSLVVVWDRAADSTFVFCLNDPISGVSGFTDAHLDRAGEALIVKGDTTRVWRYRTTLQADSVKLEDADARELKSESQKNDSFDLFSSIGHPSEFPRTDVSPDGRFSIFRSSFSSSSGGSRADVFIAAVNTNVSASNVTWTNMVNCSAVANSLQKTGGVDMTDDAHANSVQAALSGDAYVEFTAEQADKERWCGLNNSNEIHQTASDINFAIKLTSTKKVNVIENGVVKSKTKYKPGNVFRIAVESGVVNYYKNGAVFYTSAAAPVYPLLVDASLVNTMAAVDNVMVFVAFAGTVLSISPAKVSLTASATVQFSALITGGSDTITWSATGGSITSGGFFTAPFAAGAYTVRAACASKPNVSASATVIVTSGADVTPPAISSVSASSINVSGVTITWTTNEASDSQVDYGTTTAYGGSTGRNASLVISHSAFVSGLTASTLYHYRVSSRDAAGNVAVSGDFTFTTPSATPPPDPGVITDHNVYPEPAPPALPSAGGTFVDPTFGTTIMRVTDEHDGQSNFNYYSYWPTFNLDDTKFFVACDNSPMLYRFDPNGFFIISKGPLFDQTLPGGGYMSTEDAEWSGTNANLLYGYYGLKLWAFDVSARTYTLIKDFTGLVPAGYLGQMSRSLDDNMFAFTLKDPNYAPTGYMVWQRDQNRIVRNVSLSDFDEVELDKTGRYLVVKAVFAGGVDFQTVDLQTGSVQGLTDPGPDYSPGHSDNGRNIVVGYDDWNNQYTVRNLATPHQFQRVISFGNDWSQANHLSMLGDNESWCLISNFTNGASPVGPFRQEIFQASTDGAQRVRRLAHHHSVYRDYWDTPRADISRDGRFVAFTSNWGSTTRRDVFIIKVPQGSSGGGGAGGGGGGGGGDTTPPAISGVNASSITSSGATVSWTTNEISDSQVEYGTSAAYGSTTALNTSMTTSHNGTLSGVLSASTLYHYRVRSRDAAGNLAVSGDFTFTTAASSGSGGGSGEGGAIQNVVWTNAANCTASGTSLLKTSGRDDTPDAAAISQQQIAAGDGYVEFTAGATGKIRFCGLTHNAAGTDFAAIEFAIKLTESGVAEIRESNAYLGETAYTGADVFRIAIEGGVVKYYKNGAVFYTSSRAPSYPLRVDAVFINLNGSVNNAVISAGSGGSLAFGRSDRRDDYVAAINRREFSTLLV